MADDLILSLRPENGTANAIGAAIERARAALAEAEQAVEAAKQARDAALLDGEPKALVALERRLTEARTIAIETAERVAAVLAQLESRLLTARRTETLAEVEAAREAAEAAGRALSEWWTGDRPELARMLREGERLDSDYGSALQRHQRLTFPVKALYPDAEIGHPMPTGRDAFQWKEDVADMTQPIPPEMVGLPPDPREVEAAQLRRQRDADPERHGGILGSRQMLTGGVRS